VDKTTLGNRGVGMGVVNVKVNYIRAFGFDNLKEWMEDADNEYIGRRGVIFVERKRFPEVSSKWANPFKLVPGKTGDQVMEEYENYIRKKIIEDNLIEELLDLEGKNLGCWCAPNRCHGDVLLKLIEEFKNYNLE